MKKYDPTEMTIEERRIPSGLNRRSFIKRIGAGVTIAISYGASATLTSCTESEAGEAPDFNAYLKIKEDGRIDCLVGKIEMGQSVYTSLKQLLAEELDVSLSMVDIIMGDTDLCPYDAGTWGSLSIRSFGPELRAGAAEGRAALLKLAADRFNKPVENLVAEDGVVTIAGDQNSRVTYAELVKGKTIIKSVSGEVQVKKPHEFKVIGRSEKRHDALSKVTGQAKYAADIRLPGMLYASILRPPDHRAELISVDTSEAAKVEGVMVVKEDDIVAVLHEDPEVASQAIQLVSAKWDFPESDVDQETIFDHLQKTGKKEKVVEEAGAREVSENEDLIVVKQTFLDGYKAHAPIEPHTATAVINEDRLEMWASSQTPFGSKKALVSEMQLKEEEVHLKHVFLGGGFGGKIYNPQVPEAAKLAKITGRPVQVAYSRKEEFFYDYFRPAAVVNINSAVDKTGMIKNWNYDVFYAGARGSQLFYESPNKLIRTWSDTSNGEKGHLFATGAWRAPANNTNTFARESQLDIMTSKIGMDPLQFRLKNLKNDKMSRTLGLAAEKFGWTPIKTPSGRGWGIACGFDAGTWVACIAEVQVDKNTGNVDVVRMVCVQDMGLVINPHGARIQVEGGLTMGLGYALSEDIEFKGGDIISKNFDDYQITTFSMTPKIETYFIDDPEAAPQGGGEPAIICTGGAVANAIFDACGARVNRMPMTPDRVKAALQGV